MNPDYLDPVVGIPVALALWALVLLPHGARYLRARRRSRYTGVRRSR